MELIANYTEYIIILTLILIFLFIIINFRLNYKLKNVKKKLDFFLNANDEASIEKMLKDYFENIKNVQEENAKIKENIDVLDNRLKQSISKVGLVRYNPFENTGGDLCYALALLNEQNDGVVLNNIFSREGSYSYAKPIIKGSSEAYKLSEEEKEAIEKAKNKAKEY